MGTFLTLKMCILDIFFNGDVEGNDNEVACTPIHLSLELLLILSKHA